MSYSRRHWRTFNVLARLTGIGFLVGGLVGLSQILFANVAPGEYVVLTFGVSCFAVLVGVLMILVKPYRPDLDGYASAFRTTEARRRTWWTGEPQ